MVASVDYVTSNLIYCTAICSLPAILLFLASVLFVTSNLIYVAQHGWSLPDIICLLFERRHLLPTLKNALLFACAQMGGFGLGEQVVRVNVILFIGLSPPGNTNEFNPELLVISCRGGMSAYPFGLQTLSQRTFASYRRCRKTRRREGRLKSSRSEPALA